MELISIVVPVYQVEAYIGKCIESLVNQTYENLEIILVNDGTKDRSGEICEEWAKRDSRIHVIHKVNGGLSDARNVGIDYARGSYIIFVDSDDCAHVKMCEILYGEITRAHVDIAVGAYCDVDEAGTEITRGLFGRYNPECKRMYRGEEFLRGIMVNSLPPMAWGKIYRSSFISNHRFRRGVLSEDYIFFLDYVTPETTFSFVSDVIYCYTKRTSSITSGFNEKFYFDKIKFLFDIEEKLTELFPDMRDLVKSVQLKLLAWYLTQVPYKFIKEKSDIYRYIADQLQANKKSILKYDNSVFVKVFLLMFLCSKRVSKAITYGINTCVKKHL